MSRIVKFRILDIDDRTLSAATAVRIPQDSDLRRFFSTILPPDTGQPPVFFCDVTEAPVDQLLERDFAGMTSSRFLHLLCVRGMKSGFRDKHDVLVQMRGLAWQGECETQVRQYLWQWDETSFETPFYSVRVVPVRLPADVASRPGTKLLGVTMATETRVVFLSLEGNTIREFTIDLDPSSCVNTNNTRETSNEGVGPEPLIATATTKPVPLLRDIAWREEPFQVKEIRQAVLTGTRLHCIHAASEQPSFLELKTFVRDSLFAGGDVYRDTGNRLLPMGFPQRHPAFLLERLQMEAPNFSDNLSKSGEILARMTGIPNAFCRAGENDFSLLEWISTESLGRIHRFRFGQEPATPLTFTCNEKPAAMEWLEQCGVYLASMDGRIFLIDPTYSGVPSDISSCFSGGAGGDIDCFCFAFHGPGSLQNNLLLVGRATKLEAWWLENIA